MIRRYSRRRRNPSGFKLTEEQLAKKREAQQRRLCADVLTMGVGAYIAADYISAYEMKYLSSILRDASEMASQADNDLSEILDLEAAAEDASDESNGLKVTQ